MPSRLKITSTPARVAIAALLGAMVLTACVALVRIGTRAGHLPGPAGNRAVPAGNHAVPAVAHGGSRPNIVFVLTDDLSGDLVKYMPHVQALERRGATVGNYFVVDSLCCPSRAAIFTGEYPHNDGVWTNGVGGGGYPGFQRHHDDQRSFGPALRDAGYRTAFLGKYMNGYQSKKDPPAKGWDEWDVASGDAYAEFDYDLNENGKIRHFGHAPDDYFTTVMGKRAQAFLADPDTARSPFLLEVATYAPHLPAVPAPRDAAAFAAVRAPRGPSFNRAPEHATDWYARHPSLTAAQLSSIDAQYRMRVQCVQAVDRMVGQLEDQLAAQGRLANTYFVFSSDNGFHMGQYRLMPGKQTAYDTDIHVPLVVAGPGITPGRTVDQLVSSIDLAPTFDQIAGVTPKYTQDGSSVLDLLHGQAPVEWPRAVLVEHYGARLPRNDPDWQDGPAANPPGYEAMRTADALYVEYRDGEREYYDLRRDPLEMDNVVSSLPAVRLGALHAELRALATCSGVQCRSAAART